MLRCAEQFKPNAQGLAQFIKSKGGINECAAQWSDRLGERGGGMSEEFHCSSFPCSTGPALRHIRPIRFVSNLNSTGQAIAFISFDSVFGRSGNHMGWWYGDHIRDHVGRLLLFMRGAQIAGMNLPSPPSKTRQPKARHLLPRPSLHRLENHPLKKQQWSSLPLITKRNDRIIRFLDHVAQDFKGTTVMTRSVADGSDGSAE